MSKVVSKIYMGLVLAFLYLPIGVLIFFSFNESKSRSVFTGFTFDWYRKLFSNDVILTSLRNTLIIALVSTVIATIIGTAAAIGINSMNKWMRSAIMNVTYLPIINPEIVTGVSLMLLFVSIQGGIAWLNGRLGTSLVFEFGFPTLILAHVTFNVPYIILNVMPKLRQMDRFVYEAALDLGCPPFQAFSKVVLPEIMPGVMSGFLMAFTYSLDDFIISYFNTGATAQTLPITIYSMTRRKVSPEINALSTIIFVVVISVLLIYNIVDSRKAEKQRREAVRI